MKFMSEEWWAELRSGSYLADAPIPEPEPEGSDGYIMFFAFSVFLVFFGIAWALIFKVIPALFFYGLIALVA